MSAKILVISSIVFLLLISIGIPLQLQQTQTQNFEFDKPVDVVTKYFESWDKKNWVEMYSTISDGFKKIEPTAQTLADFREYSESQAIGGVRVISINEKSNDGKTAVVDYSVEFETSKWNKFEGTFTLKFRQGDIIRGWKLIHPYGNNVDTS